MRRILSSQKDLKQPGTGKSRYAPKQIFNLNHIGRDNKTKIQEKPLQEARQLIAKGIRDMTHRKGRVYKI